MSINTSKLEETVSKLMANQKGILAMDESTGSIKKRMEEVGIESNPQRNREFRSILVKSPGIEKYISGVIMFDETFRQIVDGTSQTFPEYLHSKGIMAGIKVDRGTKPLAGYDGETITEGLDGLRERFIEYAELGADFSKWRALFKINTEKGLPTMQSIDANCHSLAIYSLFAQENGIVPIQEPEVDMTGNHGYEDCYKVTLKVLEKLYEKDEEYGVYLPGTVLKPNMIVAGKGNNYQAGHSLIGHDTNSVLKRAVPNNVGGIAFLSGGLSDKDSGVNLDSINKMDEISRRTFSYGRALQREALAEWAKYPQDVDLVQMKFLEKAQTYSLASEGLLEI